MRMQGDALPGASSLGAPHTCWVPDSLNTRSTCWHSSITAMEEIHSTARSLSCGGERGRGRVEAKWVWLCGRR